MKNAIKLQNGMTPESLEFTVRCLLAGCIEKIQSVLPPEMPCSHRETMYLGDDEIDIRDMTEWESGVVAQTIGAISIIAAQSINDGIGDCDADAMLGGWDAICSEFIRINWSSEDVVLKRYETVLAKGGHMSEILINIPDTKAIAKRFVTELGLI